ncbi:7727_t:CDS:2 [Scutellospora calospora]|uniref:7727_t:CDS:1 n=1 Tax=Scutellospora calospora TaxID=85575 RepID=A0ACA9KJM4_9GLOM|nr:7727_t:CDS:2 [Scutellospora calospora]
MQKRLMAFFTLLVLLISLFTPTFAEIKSHGITFNKRLNEPGQCVGNLTRRNHPTNNPLGCYILNATLADSLDIKEYRDQDGNLMDPGLCIIHCADYFYNFAALTNSNTCRCGNKTGLDAYTKLTDSTLINQNCNLTCVGNSSYICGGKNSFTVYNVLNSIPSYTVPNNMSINQKSEIINNLSKDSRYLGCFKESQYCNQRVLNGTSRDLFNMTVSNCLGFCWNNGFAYAGLEIGSQCFCANNFDSISRLSIEDCSSSCVGNSSEICGGPLVLSIYNSSYYNANSNNTNLSIGGIVGIVCHDEPIQHLNGEKPEKPI